MTPYALATALAAALRRAEHDPTAAQEVQDAWDRLDAARPGASET